MSENLVLTPGGFRHPSLVHRLASGQAVTRAGGILRILDLATQTAIDLPAVSVAAGAIPTLGSGWITNSLFSNTTGKPISQFETHWTVPPAPRTQSAQTIFLFNALLDSAQNDILQPVLQWGTSSAGGGNFWSVACWYIDSSGNAFFHDAIPVNVGDLADGWITLTARSGNSFSYECHFNGISGLNPIVVQNISELAVATETLECYGIQQCSDYPDTPLTAMTGITMKTGPPPDQGGTFISPNWIVQNRVTDCGQHTIVISTSPGVVPVGLIDLFYWPSLSLRHYLVLNGLDPHAGLRHLQGPGTSVRRLLGQPIE